MPLRVTFSFQLAGLYQGTNTAISTSVMPMIGAVTWNIAFLAASAGERPQIGGRTSGVPAQSKQRLRSAISPLPAGHPLRTRLAIDSLIFVPLLRTSRRLARLRRNADFGQSQPHRDNQAAICTGPTNPNTSRTCASTSVMLAPSLSSAAKMAMAMQTRSLWFGSRLLSPLSIWSRSRM